MDPYFDDAIKMLRTYYPSKLEEFDKNQESGICDFASEAAVDVAIFAYHTEQNNILVTSSYLALCHSSLTQLVSSNQIPKDLLATLVTRWLKILEGLSYTTLDWMSRPDALRCSTEEECRALLQNL
jgi:hypothetical protein